MRLFRLIRPLLALGLAAALARCGGAGLSGADEKKTDRTETEDENTKGDKPQEVAGSFLNDCEYLDESSGATVPIGCTVRDGDGKALDAETHSFTMKLVGDDEKDVTMSMSPQPPGAGHHVKADLPTTHKTTGHLAMSVFDAKGKIAVLKTLTKDIRAFGTKPSLGGSVDGAAKPNPPAVSPAPAPAPSPGATPFAMKAVYRVDAGALGLNFGDMRPDLMCNNGSPIDYMGFSDRDPPALTDKGDFCFKDFQPWKMQGPIPLPDGKRRRAHEGAGCMFVMTRGGNDDHFYVVSGHTLEELEKWTASKSCK